MSKIRTTRIKDGKDSARDLRRIKRLLKRHESELVSRFYVRSLGIFGSYVRGAQTRHSDLDILVDFSKTPNLFELMDLEDYLKGLLGVKVDLVTRGGLRGNIGKRIMSEVVPI